MANCCIPNIFHGSQKTSLDQYLSRKNEFYGFSRWNIRWENCKDNHVGVFKIGDFWRIKNSKGSKYWVFEKTGIGGLKGYLELIFAPSGQWYVQKICSKPRPVSKKVKKAPFSRLVDFKKYGFLKNLLFGGFWSKIMYFFKIRRQKVCIGRLKFSEGPLKNDNENRHIKPNS